MSVNRLFKFNHNISTLNDCYSNETYLEHDPPAGQTLGILKKSTQKSVLRTFKGSKTTKIYNE